MTAHPLPTKLVTLNADWLHVCEAQHVNALMMMTQCFEAMRIVGSVEEAAWRDRREEAFQCRMSRHRRPSRHTQIRCDAFEMKRVEWTEDEGSQVRIRPRR